MENYWADLQKFIAMKSVKENREGNQEAIQLIVERLQQLGFKLSIRGGKQCDQPVIVAERASFAKSDKNMILYNHYDVESSKCDDWGTPPFVLTEIDGRMYGRGVADNKAALLARMYAIESAIKNDISLPNIFWLIQGEEEVGSMLAHTLFPKYMSRFPVAYFLEETGYHRDDTQQIYYQAGKQFIPILEDFQAQVFTGGTRLTENFLGKFGDCPFIQNLPKEACYIAFGPNDYQANIHKENESIDKNLVKAYTKDFERFLAWV